jgi:ubiquinone/menaquinone biosynthesis C-methylase UbiE
MIEMTRNDSLFDFDQIATEYDRWYETAEGKLYDKLEKRALLRLCGRMERGDTLLEVGMGTGWWSRFFSELGFEIIGIDISPKMVEIARSKRIPSATFELADAHKLPFADGCFSASTAITTIEFTREPKTVIREMIRCTQPGGNLVLGVLNGSAQINQMRKKQADGPFSFARFFTVDELYELLAPYGNTILRSCAFPFSMKIPAPFAPLADDIMALMKREAGAFIAARVEL